MVELEEIEAARARTAPHLHRTPLWRSKALSEMLGHEVYLKAELLQKTGSFKPRGMLNKLSGTTLGIMAEELVRMNLHKFGLRDLAGFDPGRWKHRGIDLAKGAGSRFSRTCPRWTRCS